MTIDANAGTYQLTMQTGQQFVDLQSSWGQAFSLPDGVRVELTRDAMPAANNGPPQNQNVIDFYSNGRTERAKVRFVSDRAGEIDVECPSPAEGFIVMPTATGGA